MKEFYEIDLHMHSMLSDGKETPVEVVNKAAEVGLKKICLTDHNSLHPNYDKLREYAKTKGVEVLPFSGCEASVVYYDNDKPLFTFHLLVYGDDEKIRDPRILESIGHYYDRNNALTYKEIEDLNAAGYEITSDEVLLYDMDIAPMEKVDKGSERHIIKCMAKKLGISYEEADAMLDKYHTPFLYNRKEWVRQISVMPDVTEFISLANSLGLITVVAHPTWIDGVFECDKHLETRERKAEMIRELRDYGLDGIEVCHEMVNEADKAFYTALADELGLITTGGSDYHAEEDYGIHLTEYGVNEDGLKRLTDRLEQKAKAIR